MRRDVLTDTVEDRGRDWFAHSCGWSCFFYFLCTSQISFSMCFSSHFSIDRWAIDQIMTALTTVPYGTVTESTLIMMCNVSPLSVKLSQLTYFELHFLVTFDRRRRWIFFSKSFKKIWIFILHSLANQANTTITINSHSTKRGKILLISRSWRSLPSYLFSRYIAVAIIVSLLLSRFHLAYFSTSEEHKLCVSNIVNCRQVNHQLTNQPPRPSPPLQQLLQWSSPQQQPFSLY